VGALELSCVEHVGFECERGFAEPPSELLERPAPPREQAELCACRGEAACDRTAENARRPGHHCDLALETEQLRDRLHQG
jgi:hypothetical protein